MFGALAKTYYAEKMGLDPKNIVSVSIMPCTAKKFECDRPEMYSSGFKDVDYVLTTREAAGMMKEAGIDLLNPKTNIERAYAAYYENLIEYIIGQFVKLYATTDRKLLPNITEPLTFPVPGERGRHEYHSVNQVDPMTGRVSNDITARAGRFIIGEQAWRQSLMQASFESMMDLMGKIAAFAPQAVTAMLVGVLELADIPNKQSMLKQVREALGQPDPDSKPTPEEQQAQAMRQSQQEQTAQAQLDLLLAKVAEAKARGEKLSADSLLAMMTSFFQALQAAQIVATVPGVAPPADAILQGGGFKPVPGGQDPNLPAPATLQPPAPALPGPTLLAGHLQGIQTGRGSDNIRRGGNGIAGI